MSSILTDDIRVLHNINRLPLEMLDQILAYEGRFRYRNGILMCQIPKNDPRKIVLSEIIPFNYDKITDRLSVELRINNYKYFRLSNTFISTHTSSYIDIRLCTFFNCAQYDTLLAQNIIYIGFHENT
jgi:hypothetical protein